jgi:regulator of RNase E activity RraA
VAYLLEEEDEAQVADFEAPCACDCGYVIEPDDYVVWDSCGWVLADHPD